MPRLFVFALVTAFSTAAFADPPPKERPSVDVVFAIDTTSSMQGEIEAVKTRLKQMVAEIDAGTPVPKVRVGLVAYRDRGDAYVTRKLELTRDIDRVVQELSKLRAEGGGDTPEDVQEALRVAVTELKWDPAPKTSRVLFLVGDAGPHFYPGEPSMKALGELAAERGIQVNAIGCGALDASAASEFAKLAAAGKGHYGALARGASEHDGLDAMVTGAVRSEIARHGLRVNPGT